VLQRSQGEFSERLVANLGIVAGADSQLAATPYTHGAWQPEVEVQVSCGRAWSKGEGGGGGGQKVEVQVSLGQALDGHGVKEGGGAAKGGSPGELCLESMVEGGARCVRNLKVHLHSFDNNLLVSTPRIPFCMSRFFASRDLAVCDDCDSDVEAKQISDT